MSIKRFMVFIVDECGCGDDIDCKSYLKDAIDEMKNFKVEHIIQMGEKMVKKDETTEP